LRELYGSVATDRELLNTAKLSVFKSVFVPILIHGHKSWVMTESAISGTSGRDGIFVKSSRRDQVRSCEILKALHVEPFLQIERTTVSGIAENYELFRIFGGLLLLQLSAEQKPV